MERLPFITIFISMLFFFSFVLGQLTRSFTINIGRRFPLERWIDHCSRWGQAVVGSKVTFRLALLTLGVA